MVKRTLRTALHVRLTSVDAAKAALSDALSTEAAAVEEEARIAAMIRKELEAATAPETNDDAVEAIGKWLPAAKAKQVAAESRRTAAEATTARARAALAVARSAQEAVEELIKLETAEERQQLDRRERIELEDHLHRRRLGPSR